MPLKTNKVLIMCCEGHYQDHLITRLDEEFSVCGIVRQRSEMSHSSLVKRIVKHKHPLNLINHIITRIKLRKYEDSAKPLLNQLFGTNNQSIYDRVQVPLVFCDDINSPEVVSFIKQHKPDLICVNGTNLLRKPILEIADHIEFGIINLHTGLSPYSRGGNCNLYMLLENKPELVGITVHHIDKGIDSGDIIISARPSFKVDDSYEMIDAKCFHIGNEAMVHACKQLFSGRSRRVKQWLQGKLFLKRTGYFYHPGQRLEANKLLENGLLKNYLVNRKKTDQDIRIIGDFNDLIKQ